MTQTAQHDDRSLLNDLQGGQSSLNHQTPHLTHKAEFEEELQNYHMNPAAAQVLAQTPLVVLNGPSGTGRNTVIRELVKTGQYYFVVSDTTRPQRYNDGLFEKNGVEYFFRSEEDMLKDVKHGEFIEVELIHEQQVSGQSIREIKKASDQHKIAVNEIEILGVLETLRIKPDAIAILLLPPSFEEWLKRVMQRNAVDQNELNRRLRTALRIFNVALEQDIFRYVVNNNLAQTVKTIDDIARLNVHNKANEHYARRLTQQLQEQTIAYLDNHKL